jgi:uncharacterized protein (TIGR02145 family)
MRRIILFTVVALFVMNSFAQTVTDFDGNTYNTVNINTQVWMKENLKVTHYNNGNPIENVTDNGAWGALGTGAYSAYNNDANTSAVYGNMYNFYAVIDSRKICPAGWHVPADWEWNNLLTFLGGASVAGGKLKEAGTAHWTSPNTGATNTSGFTLLPGGLRMTSGSFVQLNGFSYTWTSTDQDTYNALYNWIGSSSAANNGNIGSKTYGMSVRCIRDFAVGVNELKENSSITIYPNPVSDVLIIDQLNEDFKSVRIFNILGEEVLQNSLLQKNNTIHVKALPNGVYVVVLSGKNGKTVQQKLIKK